MSSLEYGVKESATTQFDVVEAIHYIVNAVVRSWRDASKPGDQIDLHEIDRIGQTLLEQSLEALGADRSAAQFTWQPDYELLVARAFTGIDGLDVETLSPMNSYRRLVDACLTYRMMSSTPGWESSTAARYVDDVLTDSYEMLRVLGKRYGND